MRRMIVLVTIGVLLLLALPAAAGGSWMNTPDERVEPGQDVTLVGYTHADSKWDNTLWVARLFGPLTPDGVAPEVMLVGPVTVQPTRLDGYLSLRLSVSFTVPDDLEPGVYNMSVNGPSGEFLGDMMGAQLLVGVEPESSEISVEWALDDPLIAELPDHAMITGPGWGVTAEDLRAGRYPFRAEAFMLDPSILFQSGGRVFEPLESTPPPEPGESMETEDLAVAVESVPTAPPVVTAPVEEEPLPPKGKEVWWLLGLSATAAIALLAAHVWSSERTDEIEVESELTSVGAE